MVDGEVVAWRVKPYCINGGYAGTDWRDIGPYEYHLDDRAFHIGTTSCQESLLNETIDNAPKGEPLFLSVFIGGSYYNAPRLMKEIAKKMRRWKELLLCS